MMKWEYRSEEYDDAKLCALGREGWEAVGICTEPQPNDYDRTTIQWWRHSVLLKRPLRFSP